MNNTISLPEWQVNNKVYIDLKDIRAQCKGYVKGTRSMTQLIQRKGYEDIVYGRVIDNALTITQTLSRKYGSTYVNKEELAELFESAPEPEILMAPPVLTDRDLHFFIDENGVQHHVEMRGTRTREGILFKVGDVMKVFEMPSLNRVLLDETSSYRSGEHYTTLMAAPLVIDESSPDNDSSVMMHGFRNPESMPDNDPVGRPDNDSSVMMPGFRNPESMPDNGSGKTTVRDDAQNSQLKSRKTMFLTMSGLIKVITDSRSGVGYQFKWWLEDVVFSAAFGTQEQKVKTFAKVLNTDAEHLKAVMSKCPIDLSCLYLIETNLSEDNNRRVFKYGFTDNVQRRFKEHMRTYGDDIKLDTFVFIPIIELSKAEAEFRKCVSRYHFMNQNDPSQSELISLCDEAYINIKNIFKSVSRNFCGNVREQIAVFEFEIMELKTQHKLEIMAKDSEIELLKKDVYAGTRDIVIAKQETELSNKETELARKEADLAKKETEVSKKDNEILKLQLRLAGVKI